MSIRSELRMLVRISRAHNVTRRYFATNGFDGALTMLGLILGFHFGGAVAVETVLNVCMGAAVALMMSGLSSAYVSESAERRRELSMLQDAMVADLEESAHARAARVIPWLIAAVNGFAPMLIALIITSPLWVATLGLNMSISPLPATIFMAFLVIFLLGLFLGRVSGAFWLWNALRTTAVAAMTAGLIFLMQAR